MRNYVHNMGSVSSIHKCKNLALHIFTYFRFLKVIIMFSHFWVRKLDYLLNFSTKWVILWKFFSVKITLGLFWWVVKSCNLVSTLYCIGNLFVNWSFLKKWKMKFSKWTDKHFTSIQCGQRVLMIILFTLEIKEHNYWKWKNSHSWIINLFWIFI